MAKKKSPAAIFLFIVLAGILLVLGGGFWLSLNEDSAMRIAFVPGHDFEEETEEPQLDYSADSSWLALPSAPAFSKAAPAGVAPADTLPDVDVFFIHPTTYVVRGNWNAPLSDELANNRARQFTIKNQASVFSDAGAIYAPRYRQAAYGAFLDVSGNAPKAFARAYSDILAAFDAFIQRRADDTRGIILAGHSQGSMHILSLLRDRFDGTNLSPKLVAAYTVGWPVSIEADVAEIDGVHPCDGGADINCVVSYQSIAADGDATPRAFYFENSLGIKGTPRAGTTALCTNPLTWKLGGTAPAGAHLGVTELVSGEEPLKGIVPEATGATCGDHGILYLDTAPNTEAWTQFVLTGNDYHVYDYNLFYMNLRDNARLRAATWVQLSSSDTNDG